MTYSENDSEAPEVPVAVTDLATAGEETTGSESLFEQLREKRAEAQAGKETLIPIPGYDREPPILMAKYRVLDGDVINKIARKVNQETRDQWDRQMLAAMDGMIAACVGMYVDLQDGNEPQQMTKNGLPIMGYTAELAEALEFAASSAREVVRGVFVSNDVAIMQHNIRLSMWMGNTSRKIDEDIFAGEF